MITLSPIWFAEDPLDYEHKQYKLLAYLLEADNDFKSNKLDRYFEDIRYHLKNMECFLHTRRYLDAKGRLVTEEQEQHFKKVTSYPDDDPRTEELLKIAKWAEKKLKKSMNDGLALWKIVENSLHVFYIGEQRDKNEGYVIIQYVGSPIVEIFKFDYKPRAKDVTFKSAGHMETTSKNYKNVIEKLSGNKKTMFIGVTSPHAYGTKETVLPVLRRVMVSKIFSVKTL